jgi:integrase
MPRKPKAWTLVVKAHGIEVRLFERAGTIYRAMKLGRVVSATGKARTAQDVKSLGHGDRELAEQQAKDLCAELKMTQLRGADVERLVLGQLFAAYKRHRAAGLTPQRRRFADSRVAMYREAWGRELPLADLCQTHVDAYVDKRRRGELMPPGIAQQERGSYAVRDGTIDSDFRWLASVFNWARRHKVDGRRLLSDNPLDDVQWPKEKNKRRPVASHSRFTRTIEHADAVDGEGRLRCIVSLARHTGRRESAICSLRMDALLLTRDRIAIRLAELGRDEGLADHMPHGAIHWPGDTDKEGVERVTPLSAAARAALDTYLRRRTAVGAAPLFPAPKDAEQPVTRSTAIRWLLNAERRAGLPKMAGGIYHPYRRLWASERAGLPDVAVAEAGGWNDPAVMRASYQRADSAALLAAVEGQAVG